jgi:protein-S-isoprenylcysteine O-methyltransferase Ste14
MGSVSDRCRDGSKLCAAVCIMVLLLSAADLIVNRYPLPFFIQWVSLFLLASGVLVAILSMHTLGDDLVSGLPGETINCLQTKGIYGISRNPLYLGFFFIVGSSIINVPNPINIVCGIVGGMIHHKIVLAEERYLIKKLGDPYRDFMKRVRRYL